MILALMYVLMYVYCVSTYKIIKSKIMHTLKITTVGNSLALSIPKELVNRFNLQKGDEIFVRETPEGFEVSPYDPDFKEAMEAAASIAKEYKNALRTLAQK
jgi:putative addiction module antidote